MATLMCLTCAAIGWLGTWVLLGAGTHGVMAARIRWQAFVHGARRLVQALSSTRLIGTLLRLDGWRGAAMCLQQRSASWTHPLGLAQAMVVVCAVMVLVGVLCVFVSGVLVAFPVTLCLGVIVLSVREASMRRKRKEEVAAQMPSVLRTLATALESGCTLVQAIEYVGVHQHGLAAEPFARMSLRLRCGISIEDCLAQLMDELDAPGVFLMVTALSISQRTGSPLRDLLQRSAVLVEQQGEFERLLSVKTAQARLSVRVVCGLPPLMVCLLSLLSPDFREGLATTAGMASLMVAAAMDAVALLVIRSIMEGVL